MESLETRTLGSVIDCCTIDSWYCTVLYCTVLYCTTIEAASAIHTVLDYASTVEHDSIIRKKNHETNIQQQEFNMEMRMIIKRLIQILVQVEQQRYQFRSKYQM